MGYLEKFSTELSKLTGISSTPILLFVYTIIAIIIIDLLCRGLMFLNTNLNPSEKSLYKFNKNVKIFRIIVTTIIMFLIWEAQIKNIITFISFVGAAATLALRDIIANFIAGFYIQIHKPFKVEDRIEVDGLIGDVINTNSLYFEILEVSHKDQGEQSTGIIIQIPNAKIFTESIKNYTKAFKYIWCELDVKINLTADIEKSKNILYEIVSTNDIVKSIPKKMQNELNNAIGNYRIYYNNLKPIIYTKVNDECIVLTIRYLVHPKKSRFIESGIWSRIYDEAIKGNLDLYTINNSYENISKKKK